MTRKWKWTLLSLAIVVPAGFGSRLCHVPATPWANNLVGSALYEIFWCLVFSLIFHGARSRGIAAGVFIATCALEFLQLWHPPLLEAWRSTFLGAAILGSTFAWEDFPTYLIGSLLGWLWLRLIAGNSYQTFDGTDRR